jgi:hypothetical protein
MDLKISKQVAKESAKEITELKKQIASDKDIHISLLKDTLSDLREQNKFIKKIIFILSGIILSLILGIICLSIYHNEKLMDFVTNSEFENVIETIIETDNESSNFGSINVNRK